MAFKEGLTPDVNGLHREDREGYRCILNVITQHIENSSCPKHHRHEGVLSPPPSLLIDVRICEWSRGETDTAPVSVENRVIPFQEWHPGDEAQLCREHGSKVIHN